MNDVLERQRMREVRGSILRTLDIAYGRTPDTATFQSIRRVVRNCNDRELVAEIQYLVDLQYIARVSEKRDALDEEPPVVFRLLPNGKRVLNGDLEDRSIEV